MLLPDADIERYGFTDYGYHLPAIPYAAWLKRARAAPRRRGPRGAAKLAVLSHDRATSTRCCSTAAAGSPATSSSTRPAKKRCCWAALGVARESWRDYFPADRVLTAPCRADRVAAHLRGRARRRDGLARAASVSQVCTHVVHAYAAERARRRGARERARSSRASSCTARRSRARDPGRRVRRWQANCVALGEAACVFDPLHGVDLQAVQLGLVHLLPLFPVCDDFGSSATNTTRTCARPSSACATSSRRTTCSTATAARSGRARG